MSFHPTMPYGTDQHHRSMRATLPEGPEFTYSAANRTNFEEFASHYAPEHRLSAVLHALYLAQEQQGVMAGQELEFGQTLDLLGSKLPAKPFRAARFSRFRSGSMWGDSSVGE